MDLSEIKVGGHFNSSVNILTEIKWGVVVWAWHAAHTGEEEMRTKFWSEKAQRKRPYGYI